MKVAETLYLIEILHQTTTIPPMPFSSYRCILSKFYIKPQLERDYGDEVNVVSYRNSTSNHNLHYCLVFDAGLYLIEILHQTTTVNLTVRTILRLYLIEILHQTTTRASY